MSEINLGRCCSCGEAEATGIMLLRKRTPYGWGWQCFQCGLPDEGAIAVLCDECGESEAPLKWFVKGEPLLGDRAPFEELASQPDFEHDLSRHPELQQRIVVADHNLDEAERSELEAMGVEFMGHPYEDPVVLYDPHDGPITDSQLTEIVNRVQEKAALGLPPYWRNEASGRLQPAIEALINHDAQPDKFPPPTPQQLGLVIQYFQLYINAPCWEGDSNLVELRAQAQQLQTVADCDRWLLAALDLGLDPL